MKIGGDEARVMWGDEGRPGWAWEKPQKAGARRRNEAKTHSQARLKMSQKERETETQLEAEERRKWMRRRWR